MYTFGVAESIKHETIFIKCPEKKIKSQSIINEENIYDFKIISISINNCYCLSNRVFRMGWKKLNENFSDHSSYFDNK